MTQDLERSLKLVVAANNFSDDGDENESQLTGQK